MHETPLTTYINLTGNTIGSMNLQKSGHNVPVGKKLQPTSVGCNLNKSLSV
jgi:hypothetical protein